MGTAMGMRRTLILLGASTIALAATAKGVEAKKVYYTIDGKRYWYSTNNRAQVEAARKRIAEAKAKAEEREKYPLLKLFAPREGADKAVAEAATGPKDEFLTVSRGPRIEQPARRERQSRDVRSTGSAAVAAMATASVAAAAAEGRTPPTAAGPTPVQVASAAGGMPVSATPQSMSSIPQVKAVVFDVTSGIKTTFLTDGSVREELFDADTFRKLVSKDEDPNSLTAFVNMVRKAPNVETTGAIVSWNPRRSY